MLKFGGSRPESDGTEAKDRDRKQRHNRSAAVLAAGGASNVPANVAMDPNSRGGDTTPKGGMTGTQQMAPPDIPYGTGQSPAQVNIYLHYADPKMACPSHRCGTKSSENGWGFTRHKLRQKPAKSCKATCYSLAYWGISSSSRYFKPLQND